MNAFFSIEWSRALGWTLFHSVWQSAIILLIALACLRWLSPRRSNIRYGVLCGAMLLFVVTTCVTFFSVYGDSTPGRYAVSGPAASGYSMSFINQSGATPSFADQALQQVAATIDANMSWALLFWGAGFLFFSMRFSAALVYTRRIKASATPLCNEWTAYIADSAARLGIHRIVGLAEATTISSPMVIGYLKPVILVPVGMMTGLTTEQLETVFLHELAHIRRHDFLVNLIQSLVETIFFFNPFVWILSNIIRREREYCCDDMVVRCHGGTRAYAYALVHLAGARLGTPGFAMSLANDKNQLLNRIKRIMEKSVRNYSGKGRLAIPVVLLLVALACISWLGVEDHHGAEVRQLQNDASATADTVPPKKGRATYSRKSIITIDGNGQPHEEVIEDFEGDESLRPLIGKQFNGFPGMMLPGFSMPGWSDTLPRAHGFQSEEEWAEDFQKHFKMFRGFPDDSLLMQGFADKWEGFEMPKLDLRAFEEFGHADMFRQLEEEIGRLREFGFDQFARPGDELSTMNNSRGYEEALKEQLLKDGYLDKGESIQSLEWSNDSFKVNGQSIDKADRKKYQELNDRFFGRSGQ